MSYVGFSRTSSNIVRDRSCGLAVSRRRCRACDGFRGSIRSLEGQGHAKRPPEFPASGLVDPTLGHPARGPASWRRRSDFLSLTHGRLLSRNGGRPTVNRSPMRLRGFFLRKATLEHVLVFGQFGAKEPSLGHSFPHSLSFGITRHFGHRFAVDCVFVKLRWSVHANLPVKML